MTRRKTPARADLEQPHRREYVESNHARMKEGKMPATLGALLSWLARAYSDETPERLHGRGVWSSDGAIVRGFEQGAVRIRDSGGSRLGSPADGDAFRRLMESSPKAQDRDGYYERPLAAALCTFAYGEGRKPGKPLLARFVFLIARSGFDVQRAADVRGLPLEEAEVLAEGALKMLWAKYLEYPARRREAA